MNIVLYQPDIPQNTGAFIRLAACLGMGLHIIEPCGFIWDEKQFKRVVMDYWNLAAITRHQNFSAFLDFKQAQANARVILLTTKTADRYSDYRYDRNDFLLLGRESSGAPEEVHKMVDARVTIPMHETARSLNVVNAASMVAGEMLRQVKWGGN